MPSSGGLLGPRVGLPCVVCGYDLRAQPFEGRCPECGSAVARSRAKGVWGHGGLGRPLAAAGFVETLFFMLCALFVLISQTMAGEVAFWPATLLMVGFCGVATGVVALLGGLGAWAMWGWRRAAGWVQFALLLGGLNVLLLAWLFFHALLTRSWPT